MKEVVKQVGTEAEFNKLMLPQRQALAKSIGVSVGDLVLLTTPVTSDIVSAINEVNQRLVNLDQTALEEVVEAYYTTGNYSIFIKVMAKSIDHLQDVLINKIQAIEAIQSTETLISLQNPISRTVMP